MKSRRAITSLSIMAVALCGILLVWPRAAITQQAKAPEKKQRMPTIDEYQPKSTLVASEHKIERANFRS